MTAPFSIRERRLCAGAMLLFNLGLGLASSLATEAPAARGGRVGWARLISPSGQWNAHSDRDPDLARFIRTETSLNIDPVWHSVRPDDFTALCSYPFVYAKELVGVTSDGQRDNLQQYLQRGGFLCIDPCVNGWSLARRAGFVREHAAWFARAVPGSVVRVLPEDHALFRCYFAVKVDDLFTPDMLRAGARKPDDSGIIGVFLNERLIAVISTDGLECGWPQTPQRTPGCMKMIVNIYVYAMTAAASGGRTP
jgi:hypothetical protein